MTRCASATVAQRNASIVPRIKTLRAEHPFWGYRRIWAHLRFVDGLPINRKRVLRLMRIHALLVKPNVRLKATRTLSFAPYAGLRILSQKGWTKRENFLASSVGQKARGVSSARWSK